MIKMSNTANGMVDLEPDWRKTRLQMGPVLSRTDIVIPAHVS